MALELHDLEAQVVQRPSHLVELVLRLDDDFVEAVLVGPGFLLFAERAEEAFAAPVASRAANPGVQDLPSLELHRAVEAPHEIGELRGRLVAADLVPDLERHRNDLARLVFEGRLEHVNQVLAVLEALDDLGRGLLAPELAEELLDVLDLERALFERVL